MGQEYDVVVVGGGSAGCALAGRLAEAGVARVLLLEAGPVAWAPEILDVASLAATVPGHSANWAHAVELRTGSAAHIPRGRVLGGSGAINGAVWMRATPADAPGLPGWTWPDMLARYVRSEADKDHGSRPGHGTDGPVPVSRPAGALRHPAAERFLAAAATCGFPAESDKNAGGPPGAGLVPGNAVDGVRVNPALAYLRAALDLPDGGVPLAPGHVHTGGRPTTGGPRAWRSGVARGSGALTVRGDAHVERVVLDGGRAVGVRLADGTVVRGGEIVLAAGAVGTAHLLLRSGIGPADGLRAAGVDVVHHLPGVGRGFTDHPAVFLPFTTGDPPAHPRARAAQAALDLDAGADPAGDCEVLLFARPFVAGGPLHLMCQLMYPDSRGSVILPASGGPPRIAYGYLRTEHDRRRLRHAVRTAADLLRAGLGVRVEPDGAVLGSDRALDGWIAACLTTAQHLCGTAAMGPDGVVDAELRVHGIEHLRVVDLSVLPVAPRRGTAATAVAVGEAGAEFLGAG